MLLLGVAWLVCVPGESVLYVNAGALASQLQCIRLSGYDACVIWTGVKPPVLLSTCIFTDNDTNPKQINPPSTKPTDWFSVI